MQSEQINEIAKALAGAQAEIQDPIKTKTGKVSGTTKAGKFYEYEYKYADLADVLKGVREALTKHEIAISQPTVIHDNVMLVQTTLMHSSGQWLTSDYPVCSISGEHQKMGAALTYAKRYALTSMVGVAADDDTDGRDAADVDAPRNGKAVRGPDYGKANQARNRGDWDKFMAALKDCQSAHEIDRLEREYQETVYKDWPKTWHEKAAEEFEKYRADFKAPGEALTLKEQLEGSLEIMPVEQMRGYEPSTKAEYVQWCFDEIDAFEVVDDMKPWWEKEAAARRRFRLTIEESNAIKGRLVEKRAELLAPAPHGRDVAGRPLTATEAG